MLIFLFKVIQTLYCPNEFLFQILLYGIWSSFSSLQNFQPLDDAIQVQK